MSNLLVVAREFAKNLPGPIARLVPYVPFSLRFGKPYTRSRQIINSFEGWDVEQRKDFVFEHMRRCVTDAYNTIPFYTQFYDAAGFAPDQLKQWDDLQRIPLITKADIRDVPLDERSFPSGGRMKINTGGTSGQPLEFYVDDQAFAREWAHMHTIWERRGYKRADLKLTLRGNNHGDLPLRYNPVHNELCVNATVDRHLVAEAIKEQIKSRPIKYVHGYPSAVYEFFEFLLNHDEALLNELRASVQGIFFGSEFPAPMYRDAIQNSLGAPDISWYGHSELAILAGERDEAFVYEPFHTYGYCEAVPDEDGRNRLVGTSYWNTAAPLIRYDTGDVVEPNYQDGLLQSFKVTEGRVGEFVTDANGTRIPLTALIFGRHHEVFSWAQFIQVHQAEHGKVDILVTVGDASDDRSAEEAERDFDTSSVALEFAFHIRRAPVKTPAGKVPLLVQNL